MATQREFNKTMGIDVSYSINGQHRGSTSFVRSNYDEAYNFAQRKAKEGFDVVLQTPSFTYTIPAR